jgi:hypothetical protein
MSTELLQGWLLEPDFVSKMKEKTGGHGSVATLQRWRREDRVPDCFEYMKVSRLVFWREKPAQPGAGRHPQQSSTAIEHA